MYIVRAEYNPLKNSIDIVNGGNYILRLDCWEVEKRLRTLFLYGIMCDILI